jgi:hypothetical protein
MCQYTLVRYEGQLCAHTKLLTAPENTLLCKWASGTLRQEKGWDSALACCHPLPDPEQNEIATTHTIFGDCDDCKPKIISALGEDPKFMEKAGLLEQRAAQKENLDFEVYDEDNSKQVAELLELVEGTRLNVQGVVEEFENIYNLDTTRLDLQYILLQPGLEKYQSLFGQTIDQCKELLLILEVYIRQHAPRRMFDDLVRLIVKKLAIVKERADQLSGIGERIKIDEGTGDNQTAIEVLYSDMFESLCREQTGTAPGPLPEAFGYRNDPEEPMSDLLRSEAHNARRVKEVEAVTKQYVPAKRNDAGSAHNDFPMRCGNFTAPLVMSTGSFVNKKLPRIIEQRNLKFTVTNELLPFYEQPAHEDQIQSEDEQSSVGQVAEPLKEAGDKEASQVLNKEYQPAPACTADSSKLLVSEPASKIKVKHFPFSNNDIEVLVLLPVGSVPPEVLVAGAARKDAVQLANFAWENSLDYPFDEWDDIEAISESETTEIATTEVGKSYGLDDYSDDEDEEDDEEIEDREDARLEGSQDSSSTSTQSLEQSSPDTNTMRSTPASSQDQIEDLSFTPPTNKAFTETVAHDLDESSPPQKSTPRTATNIRTQISASSHNSVVPPSPSHHTPSPDSRSPHSHSAPLLNKQPPRRTHYPSQTRSRSLDSAPTTPLGPLVRKRSGNEDLSDEESPTRKVKRSDDW